MTLAVVAIVFFFVGYGIRRWWALALPVVIGLVLAGAYGLNDSPLPFLVILATAAVAVGITLSRRERSTRQPAG